jgi:hypothetical protein
VIRIGRRLPSQPEAACAAQGDADCVTRTWSLRVGTTRRIETRLNTWAMTSSTLCLDTEKVATAPRHGALPVPRNQRCVRRGLLAYPPRGPNRVASLINRQIKPKNDPTVTINIGQLELRPPGMGCASSALMCVVSWPETAIA